MKKIILTLLLLLLLVPTVSAREVDEDKDLPSWATARCLSTIYKIIQHETGSTKSDEIFSYMTTQIVSDIKILGCNNLTQWRWAIGKYPEYKITNQVRVSVLKQILYPVRFPLCKFTGQPADVNVWKSYGYNTTIGYSQTINSQTVIGVGCKH
jgi:hypothetical protein